MLLSSVGISDEPQGPAAYIQTNKGEIVVALNAKKAPLSVDNFVRYAKEGFYDNTIFHRVVKDFVIQGGGLSADMNKKETHGPIHNESDNGLQNLRGTISMARTQNPNSATSQFFINLKNNFNLDYTPKRWGYSVFGQVVEGMDVVDKIANAAVGTSGAYTNVPKETITIEKIHIGEMPAPSITEKIKRSLQKTIRAWFGEEDS